MVRTGRRDERLVREGGRLRTDLPGGSFDLVYCRFLLLHLPDPMACLREMQRVLRPGGIIVVEDGDAGIITAEGLKRTLVQMQEAIDDPEVLILAPRMSLVSGRKTN